MSVVKVSLTLCTAHWVILATGQARGHSGPQKEGTSSLLGHANGTGPGSLAKNRQNYQRDILKTTFLELRGTIEVRNNVLVLLRLKIFLASGAITRHTKNPILVNITLANA